MVKYACFAIAVEDGTDLIDERRASATLSNYIKPNILVCHLERMHETGDLGGWNDTIKRIPDELIREVEEQIEKREAPFFQLHEVGPSWLKNYYGLLDLSETEEDDVPASDRVLALDQNRPNYDEIVKPFDTALEQAKNTKPNDVSGDEHSSLVASLEATRTLWKSFELTRIQIAVGVLIAVERAENTLKTSFQRVKDPLLMEAIKAFFKVTKNGGIF